ncbi:histone-fold-containing protein [Trichodelitschia bisporula]|uniref:DNA polymerase epsilon subunit D n=1 Tax=Trichodelitschia bisporula TaxID=703511 RepID=A0A6G1HZC9_9PEZI|nr:histone-fold-containing protein [Trichodelitschia bisporula]
MPPRKARPEDGASGTVTPGVGIEELNLPKTMIARLAKGMLPANTSINKEALLAISKSATVFVSYISAQANDNALRGGKKTIQPENVFEAMADLEMGDFVPRLEAELKKYNAMQCEKRNNYRRKIRDEQKAKKTATGGGDTSALADEGDGEAQASKKVRRTTAGEADSVMPVGLEGEGEEDEEEEEVGEGEEGEDEEGEDGAEEGEGEEEEEEEEDDVVYEEEEEVDVDERLEDEDMRDGNQSDVEDEDSD